MPTDYILEKLGLSCLGGCTEEIPPDQQVGVQKLVTQNNWLLYGGPLILFGLCLVLFVIALWLFLKLDCWGKKARDKMIKAWNSFFYNGMISYVQTSTLEILIEEVSIIYGAFIVTEIDASVSGMFSQVKSYAMILYQFGIYVLLYYLVDREEKHLSHDYIKSRIGNLYEGLNPDKPGIKFYSVAFFARRTFFVILTFALFYHPVLQIFMFIEICIIYLGFMLSGDFYQEKWAKQLDTFSELLLILFCYHLLMV